MRRVGGAGSLSNTYIMACRLRAKLSANLLAPNASTRLATPHSMRLLLHFTDCVVSVMAPSVFGARKISQCSSTFKRRRCERLQVCTDMVPDCGSTTLSSTMYAFFDLNIYTWCCVNIKIIAVQRKSKAAPNGNSFQTASPCVVARSPDQPACQ